MQVQALMVKKSFLDHHLAYIYLDAPTEDYVMFLTDGDDVAAGYYKVTYFAAGIDTGNFGFHFARQYNGIWIDKNGDGEARLAPAELFNGSDNVPIADFAVKN